MEKITNKNNNKNYNQKNQPNNDLLKLSKIALIVLYVLTMVALIGVSTYSVILSNQNYQLKQNMKQNFTENGEVKIIDNESSVVAFSMVNNIVSGVEYPQKVTINANNLKKDSRIRAKANVISSDGDIHNVKLVVDANWIIGDDGYYYYKNLVVPADNFELCGRVELPIGFSIENQNENKHVLVVTVETLPNNYDVITSVWISAPNSWLIAIS